MKLTLSLVSVAVANSVACKRGDPSASADANAMGSDYERLLMSVSVAVANSVAEGSECKRGAPSASTDANTMGSEYERLLMSVSVALICY